MSSVSFVGAFRVYFNRHGAAPLMWCISPLLGNWELAVQRIAIDGVCARTIYAPKETPDEDDGKPSAWIEATGLLTLHDDGSATIEEISK